MGNSDVGKLPILGELHSTFRPEIPFPNENHYISIYIYGLKNIPAFVWVGSTGINQVAGFHLALMLIVVGAVKPAGRFRELSVSMLDHWTGYVQHAQVLVLA